MFVRCLEVSFFFSFFPRFYFTRISIVYFAHPAITHPLFIIDAFGHLAFLNICWFRLAEKKRGSGCEMCARPWQRWEESEEAGRGWFRKGVRYARQSVCA